MPEPVRVKTWIIGAASAALDRLLDDLERNARVAVAGASLTFSGAMEKCLAHAPDVVLANVLAGMEDELKRLTESLQKNAYLPVVALAADRATADRVMKCGVYDALIWPESLTDEALASFRAFVGMRISLAYTSRIQHRGARDGSSAQSKPTGGDARIIAIGASTGGTEATYELLKDLPGGMPGMVVVQHMPAGFTTMYAERLNRTTPHEVRECLDKEIIRPGLILLAPGDRQMRVVCREGKYIAETFAGERVNGHCPSVEVLFNSVAKACGKKAIGIILTGMGSDGAQGILNMRKAGAYTIGQDEASCVVYGMPKVAYDLGGIVKQGALRDIPGILTAHLGAFAASGVRGGSMRR